MIRISVPWIINTEKSINLISILSNNFDRNDFLNSLYTAQTHLRQVFVQSLYKDQFRSSHSKANELYEAIDEVIQKIESNETKPVNEIIDQKSISDLKEKNIEFINLFTAELNVLPIYLATPKGGYDIDKLIRDGTCLFPASISTKVPEAITDLQEAGKSLAFELPTACGYHIFRATECVVRRYWTIVSGNEPPPKLQTLSSYATIMADKNIGDKKTIESLKQITKLHRNPLIHPETILSTEEALGILGITRSVAGAMLSEIPDLTEQKTELLPPSR